MDRGEEVKPATVSRCLGTKQAGEVAGRWAWTEPVVWTLRMLTALEEGVKGGKWFSLITTAGPMPSLSSVGCFPLSPPMSRLVNPRPGKTTNWKAGCGRSACPVWREGERNQSPLPTPIVPDGC